MKTPLLAVLVAGLSVSSLHAHAADAAPNVPSASRPEPTYQIHVDGGVGASSYGFHAGAIALLQAGVFEIGPTADASGVFSSKAGLGLALGAGGRVATGLRLDLLGEIGGNHHHVAGSLMSDDPGASGFIPYAGLRAGARWVPGEPDKAVGFSLGVWVYARRDLSSRTVSYGYTETEGSWFSDRTTESARSGQVTLGGLGEIGVRAAIGFDLRP